MTETVFITGANRGIGLEYVRQYRDAGAQVIATCRQPDAADELRAACDRVHALDVLDPDSIGRVADALAGEPIDVLINNAGVGVNSRPLADLDFAQIERFLLTNTVGPLRVVVALLDNLRAGRSKKIVNMTSRMGSIGDNTSGGAYGYRASKAGLNMINRSLSIDLATEGIASIVLHPGWVQTDMGGPSAPTSVQDSVAGLRQIIDNLQPSDSGAFYDYSGQPLPW